MTMHLLLTNDDGIDAPGLAALEQAIVDQGYCATIVAPHNCFSGCGHQVTNHQPIQCEQVGANRYKIFGTPADCTRIGLTQLVSDVDWVVSGINNGGNLGVDLVMSGTVAATREAAWLGKPGIAISQYSRADRPRDWEKAARMAGPMITNLIERGLPPMEFWNVNLPDVDDPVEQIRSADAFVEPRHLEVIYQTVESGYCFRGKYRERPQSPGSDVTVCFGGSISVSRVPAVPVSPMT